MSTPAPFEDWDPPELSSHQAMWLLGVAATVLRRKIKSRPERPHGDQSEAEFQDFIQHYDRSIVFFRETCEQLARSLLDGGFTIRERILDELGLEAQA